MVRLCYTVDGGSLRQPDRRIIQVAAPQRSLRLRTENFALNCALSSPPERGTIKLGFVPLFNYRRFAQGLHTIPQTDPAYLSDPFNLLLASQVIKEHLSYN